MINDFLTFLRKHSALDAAAIDLKEIAPRRNIPEVLMLTGTEPADYMEMFVEHNPEKWSALAAAWNKEVEKHV